MSKRSPRGRRVAKIALAGALFPAVFCAVLIFAYTAEQDSVNNMPVPTRWQNSTVTWSLNPTTPTNVNTTGGDTISAAITKSFTTWQQTQLNGQVLNNLVVQGPSTTNKTDPDSGDCLNVVSFVPSTSVNFPTGAVAFTQVVTIFGMPPTNYTCPGPPPTPQVCNLSSCLIDSDIVFNPKEPFSTTTTPLPNDFDVQSVATHEIGHFLGLDHSGIAHTMMYPFGDVGQGEQRMLAVDDVVGVAFLYHFATGPFDTLTGTINGQVTLGTSGAFGSHVIAVDTATGAAVVDGLTDLQGNYALVGVPPGNYNILAIPLAPDINSGLFTLDAFGGWTCGFAGLTENAPPCCDPKTDPKCTGKPLSNPTNYTGKVF